ncbi:hypothetical protein PG991_014667 [Apiospora marii]|uniref:Uncharacterized protein n=1 Tax=Apiospora marii TaxID=335849 RepID=A0ABR1R4Y6_9PEZI
MGDVRSQAFIVGPIARNITESSVVWQPPDHIRDDHPIRLYAVQLWDLARGTVCNSPSFNFKARPSDEPPESLPPGPIVTTSVSLENGAANVVATVAPPFTSGGGPFDPTSTSAPSPTSTATGSPEPTDESAERSRLAGIIAGTVCGTIFVVLLLVGGLLWWRARQKKRAKARGAALPTKDTTDEAPPTAHDSTAELGEGGAPGMATRTELQGDQQARAEMEGGAAAEKRLYEMPAASSAPVELPAEMPAELLARHADAFPRHSMVSALTDSRRASLDRSQVSPATLDPNRGPLANG